MYRIGQKTYDEDVRFKLGGGSEGTVYSFPDDPHDCVKLFHAPEKGDKDAAAVAQYRAKKIAGIIALELSLPDQFIIPRVPAYGAKNDVIGFLMRRVPAHYGKIKRLLEKQFRIDHNIGLKEISLLYASLMEDLATWHGHKLVVGDINAGGIMINPKLERVWVDMDSCSYPGYPALATTELFCHPDLYPNISGGGKFVPHQPHHDRFSMVVMYVLMAIHGAHPFRMGLHKQFSSLRDRVLNKKTIFDGEVQYPAFLPKREILSDDLVSVLLKVLTRQGNAALAPDVLRQFADSVTLCTNCGAQYHVSRKQCPECHTKTTIDVGALVALLVEESFFAARGAILFVQCVGDELRVVVRVGQTLEIARVSRTGGIRIVPMARSAVAGARYRFFGDYLAICEDPFAPAPAPIEVYRISDANVTLVTRTSTGALENDAALMETSVRYLYRTAGNTLMCGRFLGNTLLEESVMQVFTSQTWFTVDRTSGSDHECLFGYDRALKEWQWFVACGNKDGEHFDHHVVPVEVLRSGEKLTDFAVYFNTDSVLLVRATLYQGIDRIRYAVVNLDGTVRLERIVKSSDAAYAYWYKISGKLYQATGVIHVMPDGLVKHTLATDDYALIMGTKDVAAQSDTLFKLWDGMGVIKDARIARISKKKK